MKLGEAPGQDWFPVEFLKKGGMPLFEWLVRLLNANFDSGGSTYGLACCMYSASV